MNYLEICFANNCYFFTTAGSKCSVVDFVIHPHTYALGQKVNCMLPMRGGDVFVTILECTVQADVSGYII